MPRKSTYLSFNKEYDVKNKHSLTTTELGPSFKEMTIGNESSNIAISKDQVRIEDLVVPTLHAGLLNIEDPLTKGLVIDINQTLFTGSDKGLSIDMDLDYTIASGDTSGVQGISVGIDSTGVSNSGTITTSGLTITNTGATAGTSTGYGVRAKATGSDVNYAVEALGPSNQLYLGNTIGGYEAEYSLFSVRNDGHLIISTATAGSDTAHITLSAEGDIIQDSNSGKFIAKKAGTEFSVANSAFAGMILGYKMIGESGGHATEALTTSFAVTDAEHFVKFVAPPSGVVEIEVQIYRNSSTSNKSLYFGLSDNATYNSLGNSYEHLVNYADETDDIVITDKWVVTGLTSGTAYQYWLGAKTSGTTLWLQWGGTGSGRFCDFIMKATALPHATTDYAEYD